MQALCQYIFATLGRDLVVGGKTIKAGTEVQLLPQTTAQSVRVPGDTSLAEAWPSLSRVGHAHADDQKNLADYQAQLVRCADRLTKIEAWAAKNGWQADV